MAVIKMNKITLIGPSVTKDALLDELQKASVVDIIEKKTEETAVQFEESVTLDKIDKALDILSSFKEEFKTVGEKDGYKPIDIDISSEKNLDAEGLASKIAEYKEDIESSKSNISNIRKAIDTQRNWGEFDFNEIKELRNKHDIHTQFWSTPNMKKAVFQEDLVPIIVGQKGKYTYFITINKHKPFDMIEGCSETVVYRSINNLEEAVEDNKNNEKEKKSRLYHLSVNLVERLEEARIECLNTIDYKKAKMNMTDEVDGSVYILEGWCPVKGLDNLETSLENHSVHIIKEEPTREDDIPVEIKNGAFTRLFEPVTRLFMLPDYFQLDLTVVFAPLFWFFFGLCLGDAGWGAVIFIGSLIAHFVVKNRNMKDLFKLGMLFGFSTIVAGLVLTGSIMGFETAKIPPLDTLLLVKDGASRNLMLFYLSLVLGVFQISIGIITNAVNSFRSGEVQEGLYAIGTLIFNLSIFLLAGQIVSPDFPYKPDMIAYVSVTIGLLLIFMFNTKGNVFKRFGSGLWALYNIITGFFGDVLSYVRLFALGLAGSTLGLVINQVGANFLEGIPIPGLNYLVYLLFLIPLHALMLALNSLGSFVHPLRLTFVEFYNNAGFKGSLNVYNPFSLKKYQKGNDK